MQSQVDVFDVWTSIIAQWKLIALIAVVTTALSVAWAILAEPVYRAEVVMTPVESSSGGGDLGSLVGQFGGLASLAGINLRSNQGKDSAVAVMLSRRFTTEFIKSNNLMPVLFDELWDEAAGSWSVVTTEVPSDHDAFVLFEEKIRRISEDPVTGLITLSIEWKDRHRAAEWANTLVDRANADVRESAIREAQNSIEYLTQELSKTSIVGLQQAIFRLIENQINIVVLANVRDEYAFRVIDPAVAPDADRYIWPKRVLLVAIGFALGVMLGSLIALIRSARYLQDRDRTFGKSANSY